MSGKDLHTCFMLQVILHHDQGFCLFAALVDSGGAVNLIEED